MSANGGDRIEINVEAILNFDENTATEKGKKAADAFVKAWNRVVGEQLSVTPGTAGVQGVGQLLKAAQRPTGSGVPAGVEKPLQNFIEELTASPGKESLPASATTTQTYFQKLRLAFEQASPKFAEAITKTRPLTMLADAARGDLGGVSRSALRGLLGAGGEIAVGAGAVLAVAELSHLAQGASNRNANFASNLVGGPRLLGSQYGNMLGMEAQGIGVGFNTGQTDTIVNSLAAAGIGNVGTLSVAQMNAAKQMGVTDPSMLTPLTKQYSTVGGMGTTETTAQLDALTKSITGMGVPAQLLLNAFDQMGPSVAISVAQLGALQNAVGVHSGINPAGVMSNVLGATGADAYKYAGLLGMTTDQFMKAQKNNASGLYNAMGRNIRTAGSGNKATEEIIASQVYGVTLQGQQMSTYIDNINAGRYADASGMLKSLKQTPKRPNTSTDKFGSLGNAGGLLFNSLGAGFDTLTSKGASGLLTGQTTPWGYAGGEFGKNVLKPGLKDLGDLLGQITVHLVDQHNNPLAAPQVATTRLVHGHQSFHAPTTGKKRSG